MEKNNDDSDKENIEIFSTDDEKIKQFGEFLSNDSSRKILQMLFSEELTANQIAQKSDISLQLVKYHLNKMQDLGIVKISKVEKNSKNQDMNFYAPSKFAVVILPSKISEKAKESKSLLRSFNTLYKFAGVGIAAVAGLFSISYLQEQSKIPVPERPEATIPSSSDEEKVGQVPNAATPESEQKEDLDNFDSSEKVEPEPQPEPMVNSGSQGGLDQWSSADNTLEEALEIQTRRIDPDANLATGSGTPIFDAGDFVLTLIIIGAIVGGLAAFFLIRSKRQSKKT